MNKHLKSLVDKPICEITFDDIIELQIALKHYIELEHKLRKNATREKAKMLDKFIKENYIPKKAWRDIRYVFEYNERLAHEYKEYLDKLPQGNKGNK